MTQALATDAGSLIWLALSVVIALASMQLAMAWADLAPTGDRGARTRRLIGAAATLGTGLWSLHGITAAITPGLASAGFSAIAEAALWIFGMVASLAAHRPSDTRRARLWQPLLGALVLSAATVLLLVMGLVIGARDASAIDWNRGLLVAAWAAGASGFGLAFALGLALRHRQRAQRDRGRMLAAGLAAAGLVLAQQLVTHSPAVAPPGGASGPGDLPGSVLATLALLGSAGLLGISRSTLQRLLRAQAARLAARRESVPNALNDPLTGLPTRQLFDGLLAQAVRQAEAKDERLALLLITLDGFKPINQSFGHLGGDQVLREVANRLRALAAPHMTARMAGDEFLMLLTGNPQVKDASALAARLVAAIGAPFVGNGRHAEISCSIGIAMFPEHGARSTMIAHAQAAMSAAKAAGGASHVFFEPRMTQGLRDDIALLRDLRMALEQQQLELYYQPKIHAPSGEITGAEALLRWHHPQRGMIGPVVFIPIAERYGLINAMGRWVIDEACRQARAWRDDGLRMRVAINLSVHQLRQPDLAERIAASLQRHQINPDLLTCEVTESSAMDDTEVTMRVLGQLDQIGVHISIDDFGTGHSSLAYLRKLPADELKIDRSFVMDLETSEDARKVAVAVINLAKALNLKVVAEGVETEAQNRILRDFGCDQLQGYLFAKPMSAKALALWAMDDVGPRAMNFRDSLFPETAPVPMG